jgi:predicted O-methyltransferase YrrM
MVGVAHCIGDRVSEATAPLSRAPGRRLSQLGQRAQEAFKSTSVGRSTARTIGSLGLLKPRAGHYYSPIPSRKDVLRDQARIFDRSLRELPGIEVDDSGQVALLKDLARFYPEQPFPVRPEPRTRYHLDNSWFAGADGLLLHLMLRHTEARRVLEVGSGFSSLVMLDTNERFFDNRMRLTFVEPNAERLVSRLRPGDAGLAHVVERRVQDVDLRLFRELEAGDILFVDSSHVSKAGSDLNHLLFTVLPELAPGVLVHFHDVPYPFEYPQEWVRYGFAWNEAYLLRAFLQYNPEFRIRLWNSYLQLAHPDLLEELMPLSTMPVGFGVGGSLWLERVSSSEPPSAA